MKKHRIVFVGGGTAGHVNPALNVARVLREDYPDLDLCFYTTPHSIESRLVEKAGFPQITLPAKGTPTTRWGWIPALIQNGLGILKAFGSLLIHRPKAILGTGGYVSFPVLMVAKLLRIPYVLHEQNAVPGRVNRWLSSGACKVCLSFPLDPKSPWIDPEKAMHTGNPVDSVFFSQDKLESRKILHIDPDCLLIVVMGGSLGAQSINQAVLELVECQQWKNLLQSYPKLILCLASGTVNAVTLSEAEKQRQLQEDHFILENYIPSGLWIPAADYLVGRSGAGFLFETAAAGKPTLLIPFPLAAEDHQMKNAQVWEKAGASVLLPDSDLTPVRLEEEMACLLSDPVESKHMGEQAKSLGCPRAAEEIAEVLLKAGGIHS